MVTPVLNFQPIMNDPWSNMFKTGSSVYSNILQGQQTKMQTEKERQMLPFYLQEADLANKLRGYQVQAAEARAPYQQELAQGEIDLNRANVNQLNNQAEMSKLSLALQQAKNPYEIQKIQADMAQIAREMKINEKLEQMGIILPEQKKAYGELQAAGMVGQALGGRQNIPYSAQAQGQTPGQEYIPGLTSAVSETLPATDNPWAYVSSQPAQGYEFNPYEKVAEKYTPSHVIKGKEAAAAAEARGSSGQFYKKMEDLSSKSEAANASDSNLDLMAENWQKIPSFNKGRFGGMVPAWEGAGMSYEAALSRELQTALSVQKGNQSESDLKEFRKSLPGRSMDDYGFYKTYAYLKALNERTRLQQEFFSSQKGRNPEDVQKDWNKFVKANSIFKSEAFKQAYAPYQAVEDKKEFEKLQAERRAAGY